MFNLINDAASFSKLAYILLIVSAIVAAASAAASFVFPGRKHSNSSEVPDENTDILKYPKSKVVKPFVPHMVTLPGMAGFFGVTGVVCLVLLPTGIAHIPIILIATFLGIASQVAVSNIVYSIRIRRDKSIVFVPRISGVSGKVSVDIPAEKTGEGKVRLIYNNMVTEITALSLDEVRLASGTEITVLYAWKDDCVMVKKK